MRTIEQYREDLEWLRTAEMVESLYSGPYAYYCRSIYRRDGKLYYVESGGGYWHFVDDPVEVVKKTRMVKEDFYESVKDNQKTYSKPEIIYDLEQPKIP